MAQENVEIVRGAYELFNQAAKRRAFSQLDMRWLEDLVSPEFEYVASGAILDLGPKVAQTSR